MTIFKRLCVGSLVALMLLSSQMAQAHPPGRGGWHRGGAGVGVYFGTPYPFFPYPYSPYAYPYPYVVSPPPVIVTQPQPQVYIEQGSDSSTPPAQVSPPAASAGNNNGQAYWYFCEQANGYYPYIKDCPAGWKQVSPTPPPATSAN